MSKWICYIIGCALVGITCGVLSHTFGIYEKGWYIMPLVAITINWLFGVLLLFISDIRSK